MSERRGEGGRKKERESERESEREREREREKTAEPGMARHAVAFLFRATQTS